MLQKLTAFTKTVAGLPDVPSPAMSALQLKQWFDTAPEEMRVAFNALIDSLLSTAADSGAKNIGVQTIAGTSGNDVQAVLQDLKQQLNGAISGSIPDGSITQAKLAFTIATDAASVSIADAGANFTATNVEGALSELFQSANSVKTNVSGAIGSPATVNDTGAVLASRITTEKGRLAAEIGDGNDTSTLQYLADRLIVRSDAIATQVNAKGIASTSADTLAQLATKIGQIQTFPNFTPGENMQVYTTRIEITTTQAASDVKVSESITFLKTGTYRFKFRMKQSGVNFTVYGQLYNETTGTYIGTPRSSTSSTANSYVQYTEDLTIQAGHKISLKGRVSSSSVTGTWGNFDVFTAEPSIFFVS